MKWLCGKVFEHSQTEYEAVYNTLSDSRKSRVDRYKIEADRLRSLLAELLLRELLENSGFSDAKIEALPSGQPVIKGKELFVSLAHSGDTAICALSKRPVGIDIEKVRPIRQKLIERVCTPEESEYVCKGFFEPQYLHTESELLKRFFEIWTLKEAYFKQKGTGITNFRSVNVLSLKKEIHYIDEYVVGIVEDLD